MKNIARFFKVSVLILLSTSLLQSCFLLNKNKGGGVSSTTGLPYGNSKDTISFQAYDIQNLPNPPGMVFVQGGRTILGSFEQDLFGSRDNIERTVTVNSFYMDETEITNRDWKEYVYYQFHPMAEQMGKDTEIKDDPNNPFIPANTSHNGQELADLVPNDSVWASDFSFNDVYSQNYYSNPGFNDYPVVGVTWRQVVDFAQWRTDAVNYGIISSVDFEELPDEFKLQFYNPDGSLQMLGNAASTSGTQEIFLDELDQLQQDMITYINGNKKMFIERGLYLPEFRLPNEAEWEYAAKATVGTQYLDENEEYGRIYPWDGRGVRNPYGKRRGELLANFKRGRGDYAGIAGTINNDGDVIPAPVGTYEPNDFGLFNMGGNVSEWVNDTYRPLSYDDVEDLNPVRKDGTSDPESQYGWGGQGRNAFRSLINDRAKVYKGGSWKDVAYWMSPGTRRYLDQDKSTSTIGFRCAMISIGFERLNSGGGFLGLGGGK